MKKSDKDAQDKEHTSHTRVINTDYDTQILGYTPVIGLSEQISTQSSVVSLHDGDRACHVVDNMVAYTSHYHPAKKKKKSFPYILINMCKRRRC